VHWKITALWGGKKVELLETERAVTPFRRFGGVLRISAADRLLRSGAGASAVFFPFSQCDRSGEDLHGIFAFGGRGSAALRAHQLVACRHRLARAVGNFPFPVQSKNSSRPESY